jgi:hypothetical protein
LNLGLALKLSSNMLCSHKSLLLRLNSLSRRLRNMNLHQ